MENERRMRRIMENKMAAESTVTYGELKRMREDMKSADVSMSNFEKFASEVKARLDMISTSVDLETFPIKKLLDEAESLLESGRKAGYDQSNPYVRAAAKMANASDRTQNGIEWLDLKVSFYKLEREKLLDLLRSQQERNVELAKIKADGERSQGITDQMIAFFKEELASERSLRKETLADMSEIKSQLRVMERRMENLKAQVEANGSSRVSQLPMPYPEPESSPVYKPEPKTEPKEDDSSGNDDRDSEEYEKVKSAFEKGPRMSISEVANMLKINRDRVTLYVGKMLRTNILKRSYGGKFTATKGGE